MIGRKLLILNCFYYIFMLCSCKVETETRKPRNKATSSEFPDLIQKNSADIDSKKIIHLHLNPLNSKKEKEFIQSITKNSYNEIVLKINATVFKTTELNLHPKSFFRENAGIGSPQSIPRVKGDVDIPRNGVVDTPISYKDVTVRGKRVRKKDLIDGDKIVYRGVDVDNRSLYNFATKGIESPAQFNEKMDDIMKELKIHQEFSPSNSIFISTSYNKYIAFRTLNNIRSTQPPSYGDFIIEINLKKSKNYALDVNKNIPENLDILGYEEEVAVIDYIDAEDILGFYKIHKYDGKVDDLEFISKDQIIKDFQKIPKYTGE